MTHQNLYSVIIIGGGHAGVEAAWAACNLLRDRFDDSQGRLGRVALITMDPAKVGAMSCNPAIGGLAKGQMVREIDALGGLMGLAADATGIQFRMLNQSKGPAVQGPRCQSDKYAYAREVQRLLHTRPNLTILRGTVEQLLIEYGRCVGAFCRGFQGEHGPACETDACCGEFGSISQVEKSFTLRADAVVLTTGTFMRALMHTGPRKTEGGRVGEGSAVGISTELKRLGFELGRLKTGTPPRLAAESIDFTGLEEQPGDDTPVPFSDMTLALKPGAGQPWALPSHYARIADRFPVLPLRLCWITHTSQAVHDLIRANLDRAPMYNGSIEADCGPRYCPSIEDKVVRFADKPSHHVFLEPESLETNEIYCNGISTSLPADVQDVLVRSLPGCEHATILRHGYAVEYDMVWPHQIDSTCMTKVLPGLLLAGQINGTSGYEEAAGQGLVAGINAVHWMLACEKSGDPRDHFRGFRLGREQAYIGVMLDDLVTKTPREPYRMFTSRAEHRLLLRADNAATRLTPLGREIGLIDDARWAHYQDHARQLAELRALKTPLPSGGVPTDFGGRRVGTAATTLETSPPHPMASASLRALTEYQSDILYAGYLQRSQREIEKLREQEHTLLPPDMDYLSLPGLRTEAAQTLTRFGPTTLGQAARLAGVNPTDLMVVSIALRKLQPA